MATMYDVWGLAAIAAVKTSTDTRDIVSAFCDAVNRECDERGIDPRRESDALDASRTIILTDAAHKLGMSWSIVDDELRLVPYGVNVDWSTRTSD